ncbi:hypothetical protein HU200_047034 [Digitaria exilis]|uniref:Uncharacterized protein n=1 Tax=Digitaria exilis TaxID=1010633 RepID=A0A835EDB7_9POAL|nr:hypothetical protein HU200_047034 [Digitaria exilis]
MIIAEPVIWEKLIKDNAKVAKFHRKAFPLFNSLEELYEGSIATGDLNFTSTGLPTQRIELQVQPTPQRTEQQAQRAPSRSEYNNMTSAGTNAFTLGLDGLEGFEAQSAPSSHNTEDQDVPSGKKRKQSQIASKLGDFIDLRKDQIVKIMEKLEEKRVHEEDYSVKKCVSIVDAMEELTDEEKADANEHFQTEMNRQIFVSTTTPRVRLIWLKKKIGQVCFR